jgi:hypothetical protein
MGQWLTSKALPAERIYPAMPLQKRQLAMRYAPR